MSQQAPHGKLGNHLLGDICVVLIRSPLYCQYGQGIIVELHGDGATDAMEAAHGDEPLLCDWVYKNLDAMMKLRDEAVTAAPAYGNYWLQVRPTMHRGTHLKQHMVRLATLPISKPPIWTAFFVPSRYPLSQPRTGLLYREILVFACPLWVESTVENGQSESLTTVSL